VTIRRTLTPFPAVPQPNADAEGSQTTSMRRVEPRTETSERVVLRDGARLMDGWALNSSRGGVRAILEERVELGATFEVRCGGDIWHPGRVVWIQEEPDGVVVGIAFLDVPRTSTMPPTPDQ
jgi:PilZ domain